MKYRSADFELSVKDVDTAGRTVCGYLSTWDTVDTYNEKMERGCYAKSIAENGPGSARPRITHLWNHDSYSGMPIGKLQTLKEDEMGLYFESKIANTQRGEDVLTLYQEKIVREHSVGYKLIQSRKPAEQGPALVQEVKLYEGSTVIWGANEDALMTGIKTLSGASETIKNIRRVLRSANISDELGEVLELQLRTLEALDEDGAVKSTPPAPEPPIDLVKLYKSL